MVFYKTQNRALTILSQQMEKQVTADDGLPKNTQNAGVTLGRAESLENMDG